MANQMSRFSATTPRIGGSIVLRSNAVQYFVTSEIALEAAKTKLLASKLASWSLGNVLIVVEALDEKLFLAARNLPHVEVIEAAGLNPLSLVSHDKVLMTVGAVKLVEERLQ